MLNVQLYILFRLMKRTTFNPETSFGRSYRLQQTERSVFGRSNYNQTSNVDLIMPLDSRNLVRLVWSMTFDQDLKPWPNGDASRCKSVQVLKLARSCIPFGQALSMGFASIAWKYKMCRRRNKILVVHGPNWMWKRDRWVRGSNPFPQTELQAPLGRSTYAHSHSLSGLVILQRFPNNSSVISEEINSKGSSTRLIYDYY